MVSENGLNMTFRQKVFKMVSVGVVDDRVNRGYDIISIMLLLANLINAFIMTFDSVMANHRVLLNTVE